VLEQRIALCLVSLLCVSARQALIESVLDRKPHSGASKTLAPSSTACARSNFSADALPILARSTPRALQYAVASATACRNSSTNAFWSRTARLPSRPWA